MSLYNAIAGFNTSCFWFMPMLGRKRNEYPRFRDCFLGKGGETIIIYTRVGGGNRGNGYGEEDLYKDPNFKSTWDDDYDDTYGYYEFNVPDKWKADFEKIKLRDYKSISKEYKAVLYDFFPEVASEIFETAQNNQGGIVINTV